ncbi:MAG: flavin reductase [Sedimentisphaerales bacterium]|nr:flavin reductase [Sedimentisphaerales bacterium]
MLDTESLFKLCYGMCIISAQSDGKNNGCIVNTVFQLTPEPPMIGVSVNKESLTHDYIARSRVFTVSVLAQTSPKSFIGWFGFRSGKDVDKFSNVKYRLGETGVPIVLENTVSFIEAEVKNDMDLGSHTLFVAEITACGSLNDGVEPMTYSYYRDVKRGRTPKSAATYIEKTQETQN